MDDPPDARPHPRRPAVVRLVQRLVPRANRLPEGRSGRPGADGELPRRADRRRAEAAGDAGRGRGAARRRSSTATSSAVAALRRGRRCGSAARWAGLPVDDRLPAGSLRLAHPRAHGPGGQDAGDARPPSRPRSSASSGWCSRPTAGSRRCSSRGAAGRRWTGRCADGRSRSRSCGDRRRPRRCGRPRNVRRARSAASARRAA